MIAEVLEPPMLRSREMRKSVGRYRITGRLGEGGMGLVYDAWDDRLGRQVAVKMIRSALQDVQSRERFWREARAAGSLSHPNICHIYEIAEDDGDLFIAMERLDGESLADRLRRGPIPPPEAAQIALGVLSALESVHGRGLLHRDLKPSNVFLTPHGVKVLDFGLAVPVHTDGNPDVTAPLVTLPGTVLGTPGYMAPEQILGKPIDARSDLYAVGAMLFEMLCGKPAFEAGAAAEVLARVLSERPPALGGSPAVIALDRVVQRALARNVDDRYRDAAAMALELRQAMRFVDSGAAVAPVQAIRRAIVLPFRMLRPDPEIDFLSFGFADAISASLTGADTLVVRSSLAAARYAGTVPDLAVLAAETDVDLVVSGTMLRAGDQIRITAQLIEAPGGTLLWSHTMQAQLSDLFQVQDDVARQVAQSVNASLGATRTPEQPPRGRAHELYLRANQLALESKTWTQARELYEQAVADDPAYAPAWARLGRLHRIIWKYSGADDNVSNLDRAEAALRRALALDPDLSMALNYYAHHEMELGRSQDALVRLLARAARARSDAPLFAGLVQACRYCGLMESSVAAHEHVRRLDRVMPTSVAHTYWLKGDFPRALELAAQSHAPAMVGFLLASMGRDREAVAALQEDEARGTPVERDFCRAVRVVIEGDNAEGCAIIQRYLASPTFIDPEGLFHGGQILARGGDHDLAMHALERAAASGYSGLPLLVVDPWVDALRGRSDFRALLDNAEERRRQAAAAFVDAGGERLLGVSVR
jgi:TolB-like protein/tetratricopeptide (TPR) repeat protein